MREIGRIFRRITKDSTCTLPSIFISDSNGDGLHFADDQSDEIENDNLEPWEVGAPRIDRVTDDAFIYGLMVWMSTNQSVGGSVVFIPTEYRAKTISAFSYFIRSLVYYEDALEIRQKIYKHSRMNNINLSLWSFFTQNERDSNASGGRYIDALSRNKIFQLINEQTIQITNRDREMCKNKRIQRGHCIKQFLVGVYPEIGSGDAEGTSYVALECIYI
ncbi:unnamed protein product [Ambrosiozyma monospora]|uniref:Unnamed protein product n=1 Tax=Ambrosiozyma monospora TaxID=43982 RepID=A0A9W6YSG4_AMBMO|nr:unnamed protein product [Ambrosiozyma monospora]